MFYIADETDETGKTFLILLEGDVGKEMLVKLKKKSLIDLVGYK